ncbi:MAG: hypothetical protein Q8K49_05485 [Brevundimonas sp.]|nr:hypothetical protein [Brevundimonas sp.]
MAEDNTADVFVETTGSTVITMGGGKKSGTVWLRHTTAEGLPNFRTTLEPDRVRSLHRMLGNALAQSGISPDRLRDDSGLKVPGDSVEGAKTVEYFGQHYDPAILEALGVLMVRVNLLDQNLVALLASLTGMNKEQAGAAYHATMNMKARIDLICAVAAKAGLSERVNGEVADALERAKKITGRRNDLVHGSWLFRKGKLRAEIYRPNNKTPVTEITVTQKLIVEIAESYQTASILLLTLSQQVQRERGS